jgi:hypothetical protein
MRGKRKEKKTKQKDAQPSFSAARGFLLFPLKRYI